MREGDRRHGGCASRQEAHGSRRRLARPPRRSRARRVRGRRLAGQERSRSADGAHERSRDLRHAHVDLARVGCVQGQRGGRLLLRLRRRGARSGLRAPTYTATNLQCGQSVGVWIVAYDGALNKSPSAAATVSTAACEDMQAPTPPSGFRQAATSENAVVLAWDDSTDDVGVVGYGVYRNQLLLQSTPAPTADLTGLVCGSTYEYQVDAFDAAGNRSALRSVWVETADCRPSPPPSSGWIFCADGIRAVHVPGHEGGSLRRERDVHGSARVLEQRVLHQRRLRRPAPGRAQALRVSRPRWSASAAGRAARRPARRPDAALPAFGSRRGQRDPTSVSLTWSSSTDNVGVVGYDVFKNGAKTESVTSTSSTQGGLVCGTSYWFGVEALDAAGNRSTRVACQRADGRVRAAPLRRAGTSAQRSTSSARSRYERGSLRRRTARSRLRACSRTACPAPTASSATRSRAPLKRCEYRDLGGAPPPPDDPPATRPPTDATVPADESRRGRA